MPSSTVNMPRPEIVEIRRTTRSGFSVVSNDSDKSKLFIACHERKDTPDIIIRDSTNAGPEAHGPYVAQAQLSSHGKDMKVFVGEGKDVHEWDWDIVRHSKEKNGVFRRSVDAFRFECTEPAATLEARSSKRRLVWSSHDKGFELTDETTGSAVLTTFWDKSTLGSVGVGKEMGRLVWHQSCSRQVVLAALVSIMGIVERKRRTMQQVSRAVAWQAGPGSGPVGNSG